MKLSSRSWRRPVLRVLVLAVAIAAAPLPALAGEPTAPPSAPTLKASIQKVVAKEVVTMAKAPVARSAQSGGTTTDLSSPGFFKSKAGAIALVITAVGLGVTLYSTSNDRVKSPAK